MALQNIFAKQADVTEEISETILLKEIDYFQGRLNEACLDEGGTNGARQQVYRNLLNHRLSLLSRLHDDSWPVRLSAI